MKKYLLNAFFALLLLSSVSAQNAGKKIGQLKAGKFLITSDLKVIKADWVDLLKDQSIESELIDFEIVSGIDSGANNSKYYILLGKNIVNTVKVAIKLKFYKRNFYLPNYKKTLNSIVICGGTKILCNPEIFHGKWICGKNCSSDCKKTVTVIEE